MAHQFFRSVLSLGYVVTEPALKEKLDLDAIMPSISRQMDKITQSNPRLRHPRQITSILTKTGEPFALPDGQVLAPPKVSDVRPRKIVIMGDCAGTENDAFLSLVDDPSLLVHECTNAWVDPRIEKRSATDGDIQDKDAEQEALRVIHEAREKIQTRAKSHGHSDAEMAGLFAQKISAKRLAVNHFSAMYVLILPGSRIETDRLLAGQVSEP